MRWGKSNDMTADRRCGGVPHTNWIECSWKGFCHLTGFCDECWRSRVRLTYAFLDEILFWAINTFKGHVCRRSAWEWSRHDIFTIHVRDMTFKRCLRLPRRKLIEISVVRKVVAAIGSGEWIHEQDFGQCEATVARSSRIPGANWWFDECSLCFQMHDDLMAHIRCGFT